MKLRTIAIAETHKDCGDRVEKTVARFCKRYKTTDYDEALSAAGELFVVAYDTYDPDRGMKFTTWLYYKIWKGLLEEQRTRIGRENRRNVKHDGDVFEIRAASPSGFRFSDFAVSLSESARAVAEVLVSDGAWQNHLTPSRIQSSHFVRIALKRHFKGTKVDCEAAFAEIEEALQCN